MKGARELFAGRGGETTSNGFMGLMKEISRTTAYDPEKFPRFASVTIRRFIWLGRRDEEWCGQDRFYYLRQVERERETFAALHGRQPAHEELKIIVWNKWPSGHGARAALEWGNRQMDSLEGLGSDDLASIKSLIDDSTDVPDRRLVAAETLKIAQRGLARIERRVLRLILAGQSQIGISRQLGIGRERAQRLWNKVLWSLRSRPELASALGVRADPMPPKDRNGKYPPFHPSAAPLAA
jgi:DNA-directed RNA polymerase specialized sigma subunit